MTTMTDFRSIIVTDTDFARLRLLEAPAYLAAELENAEVVAAGHVPPDVVTMNSRVLFEDATTGERREIAIVFPQDADMARGNVSVLAPVGTALLGLRKGDSIVWPFPDGASRSLRVVDVTFQPEADAARSKAVTSLERGHEARPSPREAPDGARARRAMEPSR